MSVLRHHQLLLSATAPEDPYWGNVALLVKFDGANGSTVFTDLSSSPKTLTAVGNAQVSTADPKFGTGAAIFDGATDSIDIASTSGIAIASSTPYTMEGWAKRTSTAFGTLFSIGNFGVITYPNGAKLAGVNGSGTVIISDPDDTPFNTWFYWAIARDAANDTRLFMNGNLKATVNNSDQLSANPTVGRIGFWLDGFNFSWTGSIDEFRLTIGACRYTSSFAPPSAPFPVP